MHQTEVVPGAAQAQVDPTVFLKGRPPMGEYIGFSKTQTIEGQSADMSQLADDWRSARDRIKALTLEQSGIADSDVISSLPETFDNLASAVLSDSVVRQTFGVTPTSIAMVELDKLVVYQKVINLTYAAQLQSLVAQQETDEELFHFALPLDGRYDPVPNVGPINMGPHGPLMWAAVSPSSDFRLLATTMLDPQQIQELNANGRPTQVFAVAVGYGSNLLSGLQVGSRVILRNGSHRAYALRAAGHTHAPMLIQQIPDGEAEELLPPEVKQQESLYTTHPRPPLLRDYFDTELHNVVHVPRNAKQVRVQVGYEEGPALGV